jgi:hypothetical protein
MFYAYFIVIETKIKTVSLKKQQENNEIRNKRNGFLAVKYKKELFSMLNERNVDISRKKIDFLTLKNPSK